MASSTLPISMSSSNRGNSLGRSILQVTVDLGLLLIVWLPTILFNRFQLRPVERPISCLDQSLEFLPKDSFLSIYIVLAVCVGVNIIQVMILEIWHAFQSQNSDFTVPPASEITPQVNGRGAMLAQRSYKVLLLLAFGSAVVEAFSEGTKLLTGCPRPHFWITCMGVDYQSFCRLSGTKLILVKCSNNVGNDDIRKSFPSSQTAQSFFWMMSAAFYLQRRLPDYLSPSLLLRPFVQFLWISLALGVGLSRIMDNRHHPVDVLAGALLGAGISIALFRGSSILRKKLRISPAQANSNSSVNYPQNLSITLQQQQLHQQQTQQHQQINVQQQQQHQQPQNRQQQQKRQSRSASKQLQYSDQNPYQQQMEVRLSGAGSESSFCAPLLVGTMSTSISATSDQLQLGGIGTATVSGNHRPRLSSDCSDVSLRHHDYSQAQHIPIYTRNLYKK